MIALSLVSGLISAVCWMIGDIFLVGFNIDLGKYRGFLQSARVKNERLAVLMLSGSMRRLRFGALIAHFSVPFMLFSAYALYASAKPSVWAGVAAALFVVGFALSPVAHVAYFYVGTLCKSLYGEYCDKDVVDERGQSLANEYVRILDITWFVAVGITALGWILYSTLILLGETAFPQYFCVLTPLVLSPLALAATKLGVGRPLLNGAGFNIAGTVFFASALIFYL